MRADAPEWLRDVPESWDVVLLRLVAKVESGHTPSRQHPEYWRHEECIYPWFTLADIWQLREGHQTYLGETKEKVSAAGLANSGARLLPAETVVLSRTASVGFSGIMPIEMATTQDFANFVCGSRLVPRYLLWTLRGMTSEIDRLKRGSTHQTIYMPDILQFRVPEPPLEVQRGIAEFLDRKTAAIDTLIEKKERLIALLAEKRAALIHQAVTKGLDPDVPMKDSGVPWIGEIPAHWEIRRVKHLFDNLDSRRIPLSVQERGERKGDYPYYGASGIIDYIDGYIFDEPSLLIAEDGANLVFRNLPLALFADGKYWVNNHAHILRPRDGAFSYWKEVLEIVDYTIWITGSAQPKLTQEALGDVPLPVPGSSGEVGGIQEFLEKVNASSQPLLHTCEQQIQKLKEYRQSLITAAVTGQLEIPP